MRSTRFNRGMALALVGALTGLLAFAAAAQADFGVVSGPTGFESNLLDESGAVADPSQAGAHPAAQTVSFELATHQAEYPPSPGGSFPGSGPGPDPDGQIKTAITELPPGLIGDPQAVPLCQQVDFPPLGQLGYSRCPTRSQIGIAALEIGINSGLPFPGSSKVPVYNLVPPKGVIARVGFVAAVPVVLDITLRTDGDYGINATSANISQYINIYSTRVTLWGVPADPSHDAERYLPGSFFPGNASGGSLPSDLPRLPFMTNPTRCGTDLATGLQIDSWQEPGNFLHYTSIPMRFTGCDQLDFEPSIEAKPTTTRADAPSGLDFHLHMPQHRTLSQNEVQSLQVLASEGQFKLGFAGQTTDDLPFNASSAEVQSALEALNMIGGGNVGVSGGPGDPTGSTPYAVVFKGSLRRTDVEELTVEDGTAPLQITSGSGTFPGQASVSTTIGGTAEGSVTAESSTAQLRDAVVKLPAGMTVNPSSAGVLDACSLDQVGMSSAGVANGSPVTCPGASILGKATVISPPIGHPLPATVYLARQNENPFGSLLAIYLVIDDPDAGILIKLPGKIDADPQTGQLTVSFRENPQTPLEDIEMRFFGGTHGPLRTPATCGLHTVTSQLVPWTAPEGETKTPSGSFALTAGPDGGGCPAAGAAAPDGFSFTAGTSKRTAKAFSPFSLKLSRPDGTQQLSKIDTTLPKGLIAKLAGTSYCSELDIYKAEQRTSGKAEQASPSCPASSRVGTVDVGAGAGPAPIYVSGTAYLAGPYKGAPLSLVVTTPAVAGPFDLGNVVVRSALYIDPETTKVRAVSDPLPQILQGIPLDLRSIALKMDRPEFTLNPTDCDPLSITGSATTVFNQAAALSSPFQVDECSRLRFKPKLSLSLKGGTKRAAYPALKAVLTMKGGANIARASIALSHSEFLAQEHIRTICTRAQFAAGAGNGAECPAASIYGKATATTPLLDKPLSGPIYLRSSSNALPDLIAALDGQIDVNLVGRIDSKNGGIRTTFDSVPDAPVSRFVLEMQGGKKGLLKNSRNLCRTTSRATVRMEAQNGKVSNSAPVARATGCKKTRVGKKRVEKHPR
jgi:hypothetical protein